MHAVALHHNSTQHLHYTYIKISFHIHFIASPNPSLCIDLVKILYACSDWMGTQIMHSLRLYIHMYVLATLLCICVC